MKSTDRIVIVTGGFDPLHSGHVSYITAAAKLGDYLIVGPNSDDWLTRKKGRPFMPMSERIAILSKIQGVNEVMTYNDDNNCSSDLIVKVRKLYPKNKIIFANGGDRTAKNVPEQDIVDDNLEFAWGVGGTDKANSSSWILEKWQFDREERSWGHFDILKNYPGCKLKEIVVEPNHCLSYQRHEYRDELWLVRSGTGTAIIDNKCELLYTGQYVHVPAGKWHQLINGGKTPLHIIEIQYGIKCDESDIERMNENNLPSSD